ncbi:MAG: 16S rRNA (adenine(1518)-N(6)/adenine(1519)-N(6))-dimethyltransferase RsmA [Bacteroidota bacterium]
MSLPDIPPLDVPALLRRHGLKPDKRLGQNFLQDPEVLHSITQAAGLHPDDTVLEIGPGLGSLTRCLAAAAREVVAVELDAALLPPLRSVLKPYPNVRIVEGDILKLSPHELVNRPGYIVVANIPYYITSAIIRHLLEAAVKPRRIVLTIQKEVAQRICAAPGDLSLLALSVQVYGKPEIMHVIPAAAFYPAPNVDSAVLSIEIHPESLIAPALLPTFFRLIKAGFSQKRKTLRNSFAGGLHIKPADAESLLRQSGIDPMRRAETLSIPEWEVLSAQLAAGSNSSKNEDAHG